MRIGCDLDGVLADLNRAFTTVAVRRYPELDLSAVTAAAVVAAAPGAIEAIDGIDEREEALAQAPPTDGGPLALTRRQMDGIWKELCAVPDFWETLEEIEEGAVARLAALADARQWEVVFLTSRPPSAGRIVQRQSQRWLDRKGFPFPSVYVVHKSRGRIAEALALDVVIDDRAENCLDVALESKARAILIWRGAASSVPASAKRLGIGVVPTVAACLDLLVEADRSAETPVDFVQRLKRLLGLGSRATSRP
jgi:hypothetical protein